MKRSAVGKTHIHIISWIALLLPLVAVACGGEGEDTNKTEAGIQSNGGGNEPAAAPAGDGEGQGSDAVFDDGESGAATGSETGAEAESGEFSVSETEEASAESSAELVCSEEPKFFYFSYDDSASTAGVELTKSALQSGRVPSKGWARPWEFLNYEHFSQEGAEKIGLFDVSVGLWDLKDPTDPKRTVYDLGIHLSAPTITREERRNAVVTLIVDVSGSMDTELLYDSGESQIKTLLDAAKFGLSVMYGSLKPGDVVNLVEFSDDADVVFEGYAYTDGEERYLQYIEALHTIGSTNLNRGIELGYEVAWRQYDPAKMNRVILLTDAYANRGEVNPSVIAQATSINEREGIYFSGIGFGADFQEAFLDELTEAGKGAYFAVITPFDAKRAFKDRFIALLSVAARDVRFRLDFPEMLTRRITASEESSTNESEVATTNFSFNTSQFFFEGFTLCDPQTPLDPEATFTLEIQYKDPETKEAKREVVEKKVSEILDRNVGNVRDAHLVTLLPLLIQGAVSSEDARADLSVNFTGYTSQLGDEYRDLIDRWFTLTSGKEAL